MEFAIYVCISFCNTCTGLWLGYSKVGLDSVLVDLLGGALEYGGITECYNTTTLTDEPLNHLIKKRCTRLGLMMYFFKKLCRTLISPLISQFVNSWWDLPALLRPVWIPHSSDTLLSATHADF